MIKEYIKNSGSVFAVHDIFFIENYNQIGFIVEDATCLTISVFYVLLGLTNI